MDDLLAQPLSSGRAVVNASFLAAGEQPQLAVARVVAVAEHADVQDRAANSLAIWTTSSGATVLAQIRTPG